MNIYSNAVFGCSFREILQTSITVTNVSLRVSLMRLKSTDAFADNIMTILVNIDKVFFYWYC